MTPERFRRVRETLEEALERRPEERSQFLDEICGSDTELREEVDSLIAQRTGAEGFLEEPLAGSLLESSAAVSMQLDPGTRLGTYEIAAPIGKGGMGEVYRARDTKLERDVAIKVLPGELASDAEQASRSNRSRSWGLSAR